MGESVYVFEYCGFLGTIFFSSLLLLYPIFVWIAEYRGGTLVTRVCEYSVLEISWLWDWLLSLAAPYGLERLLRLACRDLRDFHLVGTIAQRHHSIRAGSVWLERLKETRKRDFFGLFIICSRAILRDSWETRKRDYLREFSSLCCCCLRRDSKRLGNGTV